MKLNGTGGNGLKGRNLSKRRRRRLNGLKIGQAVRGKKKGGGVEKGVQHEDFPGGHPS
ncbi:unnamed protein product [Camellia sinensis]